jgi:DNA-binding NarL/FixJ family response regulator
MIKVAIVEDDSKVREGLPFIINAAGGFTCTGAYPNAEVALKQMPHHWPDMVLMDINLPEMSGIECVAKLKELRPALQILMLTAHEDEELIFESLMAGASGYLLKRTPPAEILEALQDLQNGGSPMTSSIARKVVLHFQQQKRSRDEADKLSDREREIVTLLAKGYQYKEIAEQLSISPLTVRSHLRRIYEKLQVRTRTEAVMKFFGTRPK